MGQCTGKQPKKPARHFNLGGPEIPLHKSMSCPTISKGSPSSHYSLVPNWVATVPGVLSERSFASPQKSLLNHSNGSIPPLPHPPPLVVRKPLVNKSRPRVSRWFDEDCWLQFLLQVHNGDVIELRHDKTYHWGIAFRPQNKGRFSPNVSVFHIIHGQTHYGRVILNTMEEFWSVGSKIRINNSINGELGVMSKGRPTHEVIKRAFTALNASDYKWHQCTQFVHWCATQPPPHPVGTVITWEKH